MTDGLLALDGLMMAAAAARLTRRGAPAPVAPGLDRGAGREAAQGKRPAGRAGPGLGHAAAAPRRGRPAASRPRHRPVHAPAAPRSGALAAVLGGLDLAGAPAASASTRRHHPARRWPRRCISWASRSIRRPIRRRHRRHGPRHSRRRQRGRGLGGADRRGPGRRAGGPPAGCGARPGVTGTRLAHVPRIAHPRDHDGDPPCNAASPGPARSPAPDPDCAAAPRCV